MNRDEKCMTSTWKYIKDMRKCTKRCGHWYRQPGNIDEEESDESIHRA